MSEVLTLELPDDLALQARAFAEATNRPLEKVVLDWITQAVAEPVVKSLPDDSILALRDATLEVAPQEELSELLERAREGELGVDERGRLDHSMVLYRQGLKLKARAWKEAVAPGSELRWPTMPRNRLHRNRPPRAGTRPESLWLLPQPAASGHGSPRDEHLHPQGKGRERRGIQLLAELPAVQSV